MNSYETKNAPELIERAHAERAATERAAWADAEPKNSPINTALNNAFGAAGALEENLARLDSRLQPALFPELTAGSSGDKPQASQTVESPLEQELNRLTRRLRALNDFTADLARRVAL